MIDKDKLLTMLQMQEALNSKIHPEWRKQKFAWHQAIMAEGVELLEHIGWKWWKKQEPDLAQARIELVDIWHFGMSLLLTRCTSLDEAAESLVLGSRIGSSFEISMLRNIECVVGSASLHKSFENAAFFQLMGQLGMTGDDLYVIYVSKNVLNTFRQDHGYKTGTYLKTWDGVEDNVALEQLMALKPDATPEQLRAKLESVYAKVVAAAQTPADAWAA